MRRIEREIEEEDRNGQNPAEEKESETEAEEP
jgi:hypothetical protein